MRITPVAIVGLALAALSAGARAQTAQTTLPEVEVTAPRARPTLAPANTTPMMMGRTRVEEDKWPVIPCAGAHIGAVGATAARCQTGSPLVNSRAYAENNTGPCTIHHQLVLTDIGRFAVEADVMVFDPYMVTAVMYNHHCHVVSGYEHLPADFQDMNQVARRGATWHDFQPGDGRPDTESTIAFYDGDRGCVAVERLGPYWQGGFVWVLHATLCQPDPAPPIARLEVDAALSAIRIDTYDPAGNLASRPRQ